MLHHLLVLHGFPSKEERKKDHQPDKSHETCSHSLPTWTLFLAPLSPPVSNKPAVCAFTSVSSRLCADKYRRISIFESLQVQKIVICIILEIYIFFLLLKFKQLMKYFNSPINTFTHVFYLKTGMHNAILAQFPTIPSSQYDVSC